MTFLPENPLVLIIREGRELEKSAYEETRVLKFCLSDRITS